MTPSDTVATLGGATMFVAGVSMIFRTGKLVRGFEDLSLAFDAHRTETRADAAAFRATLQDYGERIRVLEFAFGTADRRHVARRMQDQIHQREDDP